MKGSVIMTPKKTKETEIEKTIESLLDAGLTDETLAFTIKKVKERRRTREAAYAQKVQEKRENLTTAMLDYIEAAAGQKIDREDAEEMAEIIKDLLLDYEGKLPAKKPKIDIKVLKKEDITEEMADKIIKDMLRHWVI